MGKLKNGKATGKDEVRGEIIKCGDNMMIDWIWRLHYMAFESGGVPEDCSNYRGISLLSVAGKIYTGILVDRACKVTEGLIDDEQGGVSDQGGGI